MFLSPTDVRQRVEARIAAVLGVLTPPWRVAGLAYDAFPGADLSDVEALSYAVGLPESTWQQDRRPVMSASLVITVVGVRFTSQLRSDAHVEDYDLALEREQLLIAAVNATTGNEGPRPRIVSARRSVVGDSTIFLGDYTFEVAHMYPL